MEEKMCPVCHGTGTIGEYIKAFNMFVDFECDNCKGKGWIKKEVKNESIKKRFYSD